MFKFIKRVKRYIYRKCNVFYNNTINKPVGVIFMLHRVDDINYNKFFFNEELKVNPQFLEIFILSLKEHYEFISIDDLYNTKIKRDKYQKPFAIFTIDDGYKDNYKNAYPIFEKHNIPFVIYLATDLIDNPKPFLWWYYLEEMITNNDFLELSTGELIECNKYEDKLRVFNELRNRVISFPCDLADSLFRNLFNKYPEELSVDYSELMLNWDEILEMSKNPLCTIGAHSKSHCRLSLLSYEAIYNEILSPKTIIEKKIGKQVNHFSYPYGSSIDINKIVEENVSKLGFKTSVISYGGEVRKYTRNYFALPRIMLKNR